MIGRAFRGDRRRGALALAIALGLVALQFVPLGPWAYHQRGAHLVLVLGVVVVLWLLADRDADTLGLRTRIEPSWRFWIGGLALTGLAICVVAAGYLLATGKLHRLSVGVPEADVWKRHLPDMVLFYPVFEELVYRVALCSTLVAWIGRWPTIIASGAIFGAMHFVYGAAGPDNFVAGYFMAWAYLRSGSVALPIAMHATGNLIVFLLQPRF